MICPFPRLLSNVSAAALLVELVVLVVGAPPASPAAESHKLAVRKLGDPGPLEIVDGDTPVLRYNYQLVPEPAEVKDRVSEGSRKYAVARSDYIHPLYGPQGEVLTEDWSPDHPHHRGIYWAWPEVDWQGQRGDLHALQLVFARPTGQVRIEEGADFVQIAAENEWRWDDRTPIVREEAIIRAARQTAAGRAIDLQFRFTALEAGVQVARRGTSHYGGLNVRLSAAQDQQIETGTDPAGASPRRAWAQRTRHPPRRASRGGLHDPATCAEPRLSRRLGAISQSVLDPADLPRRQHAVHDHQGSHAGAAISLVDSRRQTDAGDDPGLVGRVPGRDGSGAVTAGPAGRVKLFVLGGAGGFAHATQRVPGVAVKRLSRRRCHGPSIHYHKACGGFPKTERI